jgi:hypothetical protein
MNPRIPLRASISAFSFAILTGLAVALAAPLSAQTPEFVVVKETGPRDKRINIVILGDGYVASEKTKFLTHLKTVADAVVKDLPLTGYSEYFNIYGIFVASNQSGADNPAQGITRDTYFGASYSGRLLTVNTGKVFPVINKYLPESDMQFIVVNDGTYGGSGGQVAVANFADPEIIAHEAQHSFSGLGDEYDYAGVTPWESPNTTKQTNRASIRWAHWIAESTPVPTPETANWSKVPGLFEGAAYNAVGWYRPKLNCRMRENGIPFCDVCSETILLSLYEQVSPIDSAFPKPGNVSVAANEIPPLRIKTKEPLDHDLSIAWIVDGKAAPAITGAQFSQLLTQGAHKVSVIVKDTTHMVRKDPDGLLSDTAAWQITVTNTTALNGARPASAPDLVKADGKQAWFRVAGSAACELRLLTIDGREIERHKIPTGAGLTRIGWYHPLLPGLYVAQAEGDGLVSRSRFAILP